MPGGGLKRSPYSVTKRTTDEGGRPGGTTSKEGEEKKPASSTQGGSKGLGRASRGRSEGRKGAAKAGAAPARCKESVYQPTPRTGMKRPSGAPAPDPSNDKRDKSGYGRNTPTDQ